jgi:Spy/CpxP family protein refolding chaperone
MRKAMFILVITSILAVMVMPVNAHEYREELGVIHGYGKDITAIPNMNLTEEQEVQIVLLRETFWKDIKPLRDKLFIKRGDLKLLWLDKNPIQEKILATQAQIRMLRGQIQDRATVYHLAIRKVLTPEQITKLDQIPHKWGAMSRGGDSINVTETRSTAHPLQIAP